jgi:hypothetical protein
MSFVNSRLGVHMGLSAPSVQQCFTALRLSMLLVGIFLLWHIIERNGLELPKNSQLARSPVSVPAISIGVPHVLIGFLFLATSRRMKRPRAMLGLGGYVVLGLMLCGLYTWLGGTFAENRLPVGLLFFFFVIHHLKDQSYFFQSLGGLDATGSAEQTSRLISAGLWMVGVVLAGVALVGLDIYANSKGSDVIGPLGHILPSGYSASSRYAVVASVTTAFLLLLLIRWLRTESRPLLAGMWSMRPLLTVAALLFVLLMFGSIIDFDSLLMGVVLWHVVEWFVFASRRLADTESRGAAVKGWFARVRYTQRGFVMLHLGLAVLVFVLMMFWVYHDEKVGWLSYIVSAKAFYYWTIMHVTVSFFPRS